MEAVIRIVLIGLALAFAGILAKQQGKEFGGVSIRSPWYYTYIGIAAITTFAILLILLAYFIDPAPHLYWTYILAIIFLIFGAILMWQRTFWHIILEENQFQYTTFFLKTYTVEYADVKSIKIGQATITIKTTEKTFYGNPQAADWDQFFRHIDKNILLQPTDMNAIQ